MNRLEFKFASTDTDPKTGHFSGYGAVFGNVDTHGDVIEPGAFTHSLSEWKARGALPAMKLMHGTSINPFASDLPIGRWTEMREDSRGLYVEGKLSGMDTDRGRYHFALMSDGALNGLSIGYRDQGSVRGDGTQVKRRLQKIGLREVSLVPEGSNGDALITELKSWNDGEMPSARQFEKFLRDAADFPKSLAAGIASKAAPLLRGEPEAKADDDAQSFLKALLG